MGNCLASCVSAEQAWRTWDADIESAVRSRDARGAFKRRPLWSSGRLVLAAIVKKDQRRSPSVVRATSRSVFNVGQKSAAVHPNVARYFPDVPTLIVCAVIGSTERTGAPHGRNIGV